MEEENDDLSPDSPQTPDPEICNNNNNEPFISELDKKTSSDIKEDSHSIMENGVPAAVMFPMETPAFFPENVTLGPGPRPGLLVCSPAVKSCTEKSNSEKTDSSELEVSKI